MATTYMSITLPTIGTTTGPTGHTQINTAIETIDAHDHTTGKGTTIPTSALNINANLNFNGYNLTNVGTFSCGAATVTSLTSSGAISGTTGTFTGALGGTTATFSGNLAAAAGTFSGLVTATGGLTSGANVVSDTNNTDTLGTSGVRWANVFSVLGNFSGNLTTSALVAAANDNHDIGSSGTRYKDIYAGTLNLSKAAVTGITISSSTGIPGVFTNYSADTVGPTIFFQKSRHATLGSNTIVQSGDVLGKLQFLGANGTGYTNAAEIQVSCPGTPGASNDMPGQITFKTTPDGSGTLTDALYILSNQTVAPASTLRPAANGTQDCGGSSFRWANVYSVLGNLTGTLTIASASTSAFAVTSGGSVTSSFAQYSATATSNTGFRILLQRSNSDSVGTHTLVGAGDQLGAIFFQGSNGTSFSSAATISCLAGATPAAGTDMPGRLLFATSADGSATPTNAVEVTATQDLTLMKNNASGPVSSFSARNCVHAWARVVATGAGNPTYTAANSYNVTSWTWSSTGVYVITVTTAEGTMAAPVVSFGGTTSLTHTLTRDSSTQYTLRTYNSTTAAAADVANTMQISFILVGY